MKNTLLILLALIPFLGITQGKTTIKIKAKKSKLSKRRRPAELQNTKIKKRTEYTGFFDRITIKAEAEVRLIAI